MDTTLHLYSEHAPNRAQALELGHGRPLGSALVGLRAPAVVIHVTMRELADARVLEMINAARCRVINGHDPITLEVH